MSRTRRVVYGFKDLDRSEEELIRDLVDKKIIVLVENDIHWVIGRWGTNKSELKKFLPSAGEDSCPTIV